MSPPALEKRQRTHGQSSVGGAAQPRAVFRRDVARPATISRLTSDAEIGIVQAKGDITRARAPRNGNRTMNKTGLKWLGHSLAASAAALLTACASESPLATDPQPAPPLRFAGTSPADRRVVDLGACDDLRAPEGSKLAFRAYAEGVQIYRWNGTSWTFVGPSAALSADAEGRGTVGSHYAGPTWESVSGSKVVGAVLKRCSPNPNAIPWLLLGAVSSEGPGIFHRVTSVQRLNTVGGNAPSGPGSAIGEEARVPYTAEYLFYRAQ